MATNRLEDARRALITNDREVYDYISDFITERCFDTAGNLASGKNCHELANQLWEYSGLSNIRNQERVAKLS